MSKEYEVKIAEILPVLKKRGNETRTGTPGILSEKDPSLGKSVVAQTIPRRQRKATVKAREKM